MRAWSVVCVSVAILFLALAPAVLAQVPSPLCIEAQDACLYRLGANHIGQMNKNSSQAFSIYDVFTDSSNYARASLIWSSSIFEIRTEKLGSPLNRSLYLNPSSNITFSKHISPVSTSLYTLGTAGALWASAAVAESIQGSKSKTLTDNTATAFVRLSVADDDYEGCELIWTAYAEDADTDARQTRTGTNTVAILNNSGTETAAFSTGDSAVVVTAGTLTCTFDTADGGTNLINLRATCDTSLDAAAETLTFEYRLDCPSTLTVTPL